MGLTDRINRWLEQPPPEDTDAPRIKPKVLIGVAGFHGVTPEAQENFYAFAYECGRRCPDYDFFIKIIIKREQFRARNNLVDLAIINDCQWLLMLDDDMVIPPDLFKRLAAHEKDIVGALYFQRGGGFHPVVMRRIGGKDGLQRVDFIHSHDKIVTQPGLHKADVIGGGCMLMKTDIFRKIPQPYFWIDGIVGTDVHLCNQLRDVGVDIWIDSEIELGHIGDPITVTSRTIPKYSQTLGRVNEELWNDLKEYLAANDDLLESSIVRASHAANRKALWNMRPRETWQDVLEFYREGGTAQIESLAMFNLKYDQARDWVINDIDRTAKPGAHIVDYGSGLGYCAISMAKLKGYDVTALELSKTPTADFLQWRIQKHGLDGKIRLVEFDTPVPPDLQAPADGVVMISVFDHLWNPYGTLDWLGRNVKKGGFLLCDTWRNMKDEDEPQHLVKYDPHRIIHDFRRMGWRDVPENPFLFFKEK